MNKTLFPYITCPYCKVVQRLPLKGNPDNCCGTLKCAICKNVMDYKREVVVKYITKKNKIKKIDTDIVGII